MLDHQRDIRDGTLTVRTAKEGDARRISFCGELDLANAGTAKTQLGLALDDADARVIVDLRELEFIDSTGIALLVAVLRRNGSSSRLRFIPSRAPAVCRVLQLTGVDERMPTVDG